MSNLCYLCLLAYSGVNTYFVVFLFYFSSSMFRVSLDCLIVECPLGIL